MLKALLKTMRPHQWTKNIFIFVALVFDEKLFDLPSITNTCLGFILLCLSAGTIYIINDLVDVEKDRQHPTKKFRPLAAEQLTEKSAIGSIFILLLITITGSFWLNTKFGLLIICYLVLQTAYSFKLKNMVIIDVFTVAAGFFIRVVAGVVLIEVSRFSPWLYIFTIMLSLFLGFGKRRQELILNLNGLKNTRPILKEYSLPLIDQMITVVITGAIMTYAFYSFSAPNLPDNHTMMLTIPFLIYGIFRYLYLLHVKESSGDPSEIVLKDRPLQLTLLLCGFAVVFILYWNT